jgi:hypothetical protein
MTNEFSPISAFMQQMAATIASTAVSIDQEQMKVFF